MTTLNISQRLLEPAVFQVFIAGMLKKLSLVTVSCEKHINIKIAAFTSSSQSKPYWSSPHGRPISSCFKPLTRIISATQYCSLAPLGLSSSFNVCQQVILFIHLFLIFRHTTHSTISQGTSSLPCFKNRFRKLLEFL